MSPTSCQTAPPRVRKSKKRNCNETLQPRQALPPAFCEQRCFRHRRIRTITPDSWSRQQKKEKRKVTVQPCPMTWHGTCAVMESWKTCPDIFQVLGGIFDPVSTSAPAPRYGSFAGGSQKRNRPAAPLKQTVFFGKTSVIIAPRFSS